MAKAKAELIEAEKLDDELRALCKRMRIMSSRDTDATLPQVLKAMMLYSKDKPIGGSELSEISGINRITVIHHLKKLEGAGFVRREKAKYILRVHSAEEMILEFRKEMERAFSEMDELAREIDSIFEKEWSVFHGRKKR